MDPDPAPALTFSYTAAPSVPGDRKRPTSRRFLRRAFPARLCAALWCRSLRMVSRFARSKCRRLDPVPGFCGRTGPFISIRHHRLRLIRHAYSPPSSTNRPVSRFAFRNWREARAASLSTASIEIDNASAPSSRPVPYRDHLRLPPADRCRSDKLRATSSRTARPESSRDGQRASRSERR